ncbi:hypothetical protein PVL30_002633 [Lodderomyces elongisporus]|uniref:uncharacterized protein n=1 Tax=Lodderomyces elongisporus TaxID=36914 RepID=UPI0029269BA4|nr:uncharacterized protein PVL30_002633 [Lodderomyces elongisporus]WLF78887.1 hypothetical protein PVL30_002633 [Lodderomyces elongisporus]
MVYFNKKLGEWSSDYRKNKNFGSYSYSHLNLNLSRNHSTSKTPVLTVKMTDISAKSLKDDLDVLSSQDYYFLKAREDVEKFSITNPQRIEEAIEEWQRIFTRLSFHYQERTNREMFLLKVKSMSRDQLSALGGENKERIEREAALMEEQSANFDEERTSRIDELKVLAQEVSDMYDQFQTKRNQVEKNIAEADSLEREIDQILNNVGDRRNNENEEEDNEKRENEEGHMEDNNNNRNNNRTNNRNNKSTNREILDYMLANDITVLSPSSKLDSQEKDKVEDQVKQIETEIEGIENRYIEERRRLEIVNDKIKQLQSHIDQSEPIESPSQNRLLWYKEMSRILMNLGGVKEAELSINIRGDYRLKIITNEKELNATLEDDALVIDGVTDSSDKGQRISQLDDEEKMNYIVMKIRDKLS